ncbi:helix-turn-helix transcriptional regulator [Marinobacterium stanieri]|uniref:helix-turn-helix transcriptional regulator n=1 Tax=Marinobacterium stanieri TaxID=49186 RepID=UPI000255A321|nr:helix-turn-helix transcriptional regulator [Marinobacterium stanieri]
MNLAAAPADTSFTASDFHALGRKYDIRYCFPEAGHSSSRPVLRGHVREQSLASGFQLTLSDVQVLSPYESRSTGASSLFICSVLEGQLDFSVGHQSFALQPGMALSLSLHQAQPVTVYHRAEQHLRTLTLAHPQKLPEGSPFSHLLNQVRASDTPQLWRLSPALHQQLNEQISHAPLGIADKLILEGLSLQLLGQHGQQQDQHPLKGNRKLSPAESSRLHALHAQIIAVPEAPYDLATLAQQTAMSGSSLRSKFRDLFDEPLFDFIRRQRLTKAHALLASGHAIEHTAYICGYRHASNFTTAFKRQFGYSPGSLLRQT